MSKNDKHFTVEEWADFGRGRCSREARSEMERHLAEGCKRCGALLELWTTVLDLAQREDAFAPPSNTVRCAKSLYGALPLREGKWRLSWARLAAFDQPAMAGVRGAAPAANHFLFQEGSLLLDLYMQPQAASGRVAVVGQLLDSSRPDRQFENQTVILLQDLHPQARTTTDEFGEFRLEFTPGDDLILTIELEDQSLVSHLPCPRDSKSGAGADHKGWQLR